MNPMHRDAKVRSISGFLRNEGLDHAASMVHPHRQQDRRKHAQGRFEDCQHDSDAATGDGHAKSGQGKSSNFSGAECTYDGVYHVARYCSSASNLVPAHLNAT
jgi:hypothetical protein